MKKTNISKSELLDSCDIEYSIINSLMYENKILNKKLKKQKLTSDEEFFDKFIISPSSILRIIERKKRNYESK